MKKAYKRICETCHTEHFSSETKCRECRGLEPIPTFNNAISHIETKTFGFTERWDNLLSVLEENSYYPEAIADGLLEFLERKKEEIEENEELDRYNMEKMNRIIRAIYDYLGDDIWLNLSDKELWK